MFYIINIIYGIGLACFDFVDTYIEKNYTAKHIFSRISSGVLVVLFIIGYLLQAIITGGDNSKAGHPEWIGVLIQASIVVAVNLVVNIFYKT